jgi:hypothetical protein
VPTYGLQLDSKRARGERLYDGAAGRR